MPHVIFIFFKVTLLKNDKMQLFYDFSFDQFTGLIWSLGLRAPRITVEKSDFLFYSLESGTGRLILLFLVET